MINDTHPRIKRVHPSKLASETLTRVTPTHKRKQNASTRMTEETVGQRHADSISLKYEANNNNSNSSKNKTHAVNR